MLVIGGLVILTVENKAFKIAGIKNLMERNYDVSSSLIDLESLVDNTLSMRENWCLIKPKVLMLTKKRFFKE